MRVKVVYRIDSLPFAQAPEGAVLQHCWWRAEGGTPNGDAVTDSRVLQLYPLRQSSRSTRLARPATSDVLRMDAVFLDLVAEDALGEAQFLGGLALLAAALLQGVDDQLPLLVGDDLRERGLGARIVSCLIICSDGGRCSLRITSSSQSRTARSMQFSSSRMLPGQW